MARPCEQGDRPDPHSTAPVFGLSQGPEQSGPCFSTASMKGGTPLSEESLPQVATKTQEELLVKVDARMLEIKTARENLQKQDKTLLEEQEQLRAARTGLTTALRIPRTPAKRAGKTAPAAEPQKTTEPKPTKAKTGEARVTDAAKT